MTSNTWEHGTLVGLEAVQATLTIQVVASTFESVYAINWADGKILWHLTDANVLFEDPIMPHLFFTGAEKFLIERLCVQR